MPRSGGKRWSSNVSDFVLRGISWSPKPDNVVAGIAELDLAPCAFLLLDDSTQVAPSAVCGSNTRSTQTYRTRPCAAQRRDVLQSTTHDFAALMASLEFRGPVRSAGHGDMPWPIELLQRTT